jgi:hypothetical protein
MWKIVYAAAEYELAKPTNCSLKPPPRQISGAYYAAILKILNNADQHARY